MALYLAESNSESDEAAFELVPESGTRARNIERFRAGDLVDNRYRVFGSAATGGMGSVYVGEDTLLGRRVAIKLMRSDGYPEERLAERFLAEARITAQLQNSHVVQLFDCATLDSGEPFIVMEFVEGSDLFAILRAEGPLAPENVVRYMLQVCEGLRAVHAHGIVHCDLKPENLIRVRTGEGTEIIKIVDFGVARQKGLPRMGELASPGVACGSPNYMSPEQIQGSADLDARTDIWALGVVMFELLTGKLPFVGGDESRIGTSVVSDPAPSVASLGVRASVELEAVISRCLKKAREERFANVDELMLALALVVLRQNEENLRADGPVTSPSADIGDAAETPVDDCLLDVAEAPRSHRRHLGHGIAVMIVLSVVLWGRSDTSHDAGSLEGARETPAVR